jgi:hypothetical protein
VDKQSENSFMIFDNNYDQTHSTPSRLGSRIAVFFESCMLCKLHGKWMKMAQAPEALTYLASKEAF